MNRKPIESDGPTVFGALRPRWIGGDKYGYLYDVSVNGETIVSRSHSPGHDACRALLGRGITGRLTLTDLAGSPRISFDIEEGAKWIVIEDDERGLLIVPYKAWPGRAAVGGAKPKTELPGVPLARDEDAPTPRRPLTQKHRSSEGEEDYPYVILRLGQHWRIVECRDDLQWIFQRRSGVGWRSNGFCRTRIGLRAMLCRNGLDAACVDAFPEMYPEGKRGTGDAIAGPQTVPDLPEEQQLNPAEVE